MNELDKKLFSRLDEYVDKELKFGCVATFQYDIDESAGIWLYLWQNKRLTHSPDLFRYNSNWNVVGFDKKLLRIWQSFSPIWQIHLWTILQWWLDNNIYIKRERNIDTKKQEIIISNWKNWSNYIWIALPLTPPLERTDEQKQDFISFAESI